MIVDTLRMAVEDIRATYSHEDVDDLDAATFYLAVADWLDECARCIRSPKPYVEQDSPADHALRIARAYLGEATS